MDKLINLLKLTELELKNTLYNELLGFGMFPIYKDGYIYSKGDIPILLVAHMDTILSKPPANLEYDEKEDKISLLNSSIGGDDRCGVYAILKILEHGYRPHVLFTEEEEKGGIGAKKVIETLEKPDVKYLLEFDRRGFNDCVFYDCGNEDFISYIESFGFEKNYGTFSDISVLAPHWDKAAVNISCGYYYEHTKKEYIIFNELIKNIYRVEEIISTYCSIDYFDYQKLIKPTLDMSEEELEKLIRQMIEKKERAQKQKKIEFKNKF